MGEKPANIFRPAWCSLLLALSPSFLPKTDAQPPCLVLSPSTISTGITSRSTHSAVLLVTTPRAARSVLSGAVAETPWKYLLAWLQKEVVADFKPEDRLLYLPLSTGQWRVNQNISPFPREAGQVGKVATKKSPCAESGTRAFLKISHCLNRVQHRIQRKRQHIPGNPLKLAFGNNRFRQQFDLELCPAASHQHFEIARFDFFICQ